MHPRSIACFAFLCIYVPACTKLPHLFYVLVCPSPTGNGGIIQSYNYPYNSPTNIKCFWKLEAPRNYRVRLYMLQETYRYSWSYRRNRCSSGCNSLVVYDGLAITDTKLAEKKYNEYFNLVSSSNHLSLLQKTYRRGSSYDVFRVKYIFIRESEGKSYVTYLLVLSGTDDTRDDGKSIIRGGEGGREHICTFIFCSL